MNEGMDFPLLLRAIATLRFPIVRLWLYLIVFAIVAWAQGWSPL